MRIIELYGFSASGKLTKQKKIAAKESLDLSFLLISKKKDQKNFCINFFIYSILN